MVERWVPPELFLGYLQGTEAPADKRQRLSLSEEDRKTGLHVIGAPKTGKSKFLEHLIRQDIRASHGLCLIDPHGELYDDVLEWCASVGRPRRPLIPLNLSTGEHIIGCNFFINRDGNVAAQVERCLAAVTKAYGQPNTDQTPTLDTVMSDLFHIIIEADDLTLCEAHYFLTQSEPAERDYLISRITDPEIRTAWQDLAKIKTFDQFLRQVGSTRSRVRRILRAATPRRSLALPDPVLNLDIARVMNEGAILLVNLKRSRQLTEKNQRLFGSLLVNAFIDAGFERDPATARPFTLYLDEFYNFITADIGQALPQLRKFNVRFVLAHQTLSQLRRDDADILEAVMGAVQARVVFGGLQHKDALQLAPDMFAGQTDYTEVKYWRETVKFWPVYDRERVRSRGRAHTDTESDSETVGHTDITGSGSHWADAQSDHGGTGHSVPYVSGFPAPGGGQYFDSSGWGFVSTTGGSSMSSSADSVAHGTTRGSADTTNEGEADVPIYRPVPYLDRQPEHFSLEEQRDRQATLLMRQYQRHAFVRSPGGFTKPMLVPHVPRFKLEKALVRHYEADKAKQAGAKAPEEVDAILNARDRRLKQQAREFAVTEAPDVHSVDHAAPPPQRRPAGLQLNPERPKRAALAARPGGEEEPARPVHGDEDGEDPADR